MSNEDYDQKLLMSAARISALSDEIKSEVQYIAFVMQEELNKERKFSSRLMDFINQFMLFVEQEKRVEMSNALHSIQLKANESTLNLSHKNELDKQPDRLEPTPVNNFGPIDFFNHLLNIINVANENQALSGETDNIEDNGEKFRCSVCGKSFSTSDSLRRHQARAHKLQVQNGLPCTVCKKKFINAVTLCNHIKLEHKLNYGQKSNVKVSPTEKKHLTIRDFFISKPNPKTENA